MLFTDRPNFAYDPKLAALLDTQNALRHCDEAIRAYSPRHPNAAGSVVPAVEFLEVDRSPGKIDSLWNMPKAVNTEFSRQLCVQCINSFEKPDWRLKAQGLTPQRVDRFWISNLELQRLNYWPTRGDQVRWNGYRYEMIEGVVLPEAYWGQTGVWTNMVCRCTINPTGDGPTHPGTAPVPAELSQGPVTSR